VSQIRIELARQSPAFEPGESVEGVATWQLDSPNTALEIHLTWRTTGKGIPDSACVETIRIDRPGTQGSHPFSFKLPPGPYSFSGQLISLTWCIEAEAMPEKVLAQQLIVLALGRAEVVLASSV
jgi:hypothetical protein